MARGTDCKLRLQVPSALPAPAATHPYVMREKQMGAYLYTWNPKHWTWTDQPEAICRIADGDAIRHLPC